MFSIQNPLNRYYRVTPFRDVTTGAATFKVHNTVEYEGKERSINDLFLNKLAMLKIFDILSNVLQNPTVEDQEMVISKVKKSEIILTVQNRQATENSFFVDIRLWLDIKDIKTPTRRGFRLYNRQQCEQLVRLKEDYKGVINLIEKFDDCVRAGYTAISLKYQENIFPIDYREDPDLVELLGDPRPTNVKDFIRNITIEEFAPILEKEFHQSRFSPIQILSYIQDHCVDNLASYISNLNF